jgi:hypothetical protein
MSLRGSGSFPQPLSEAIHCTVKRRTGQVHVVVRKHAALIDHLLPHTRSTIRITRHVMASFIVVCNRNTPSNDVLVSLSGLEYFVKHFPVLVQFVF